MSATSKVLTLGACGLTWFTHKSFSYAMLAELALTSMAYFGAGGELELRYGARKFASMVVTTLVIGLPLIVATTSAPLTAAYVLLLKNI